MSTGLLLLRRAPAMILWLAFQWQTQAGLILQNEGGGSYGVNISQRIGQSFTAEDERLRTAGFYIESYPLNSPDSQLKCELLAGSGTNGAVLATAVKNIGPGIDDFADFDFSSAPALTVGGKYTLLLTALDGAQYSVGTHFAQSATHPYAGGQMYVNGSPLETADLRFRIIPAGLDVSYFGFATNRVSALEADQGVTIAVNRIGNTGSSADISFKSSVPFMSGAIPGRHYQAQSGSLRFEPGDSSKSIVIPIANDETFDTNKVFDLELSSTDSSVLFNISRVRVEIRDDDGIQLYFTKNEYFVNEDEGNVTFTVERSGKLQQSLTVHYGVTEGGARNGEDFIASPGELTFGPNVTQASFAVAILPDRLVEGDEYFFVHANLPGMGTNIPSFVRVSDRTSLAEFPYATTNLSETSGDVQIPVVRRGYAGKEMTLAYRTEPLTATAGEDYTAADGQISFAAGELVKTIPLTILNDTLAEPSETFVTKLLPAGATDFLGNRAALSVTLSNNASIVSFAATNVTVVENGGSARVVLTRGGLLSIESTVLFATGGPESAEPGLDYTARAGQVTFAPGQTEAAFEIPILDDLRPESNEWFRVNISSGSANLTLAQREAQITIIDNSSIVGFISTNLTGLESAGSVTLAVLRTGDISQASSLKYATEDGTARAGVHYTGASGVLEFAAGQASKQIVTPILDNGLAESDVLFSVRLSEPVQEAKLGAASVAHVVIANDDQTVQFASATFTAFTGSDSVRVALTRGPGAIGTAQVRVQTADGTAQAGEDYQAVDQTVRFEPGQLVAAIDVPLLGSRDPAKIGRQFSVQISEPAGAALGSVSEATVTYAAASTFHYDYAFAERAAEFGNIETPALIGVQPGGKIIFRQSNLQRANADGSPDPSFQSSQSAFGALLQSQGQIVWGVYINGEYVVRRLTKDGAPDPSFSTFGTGSPYNSLWVDPQDRIHFMRANNIGRASKDGMVDPVFSIPHASLAFDANGRIFASTSTGFRRYSPDGVLEKEAGEPDRLLIQSLGLAPDGKPLYLATGPGGPRIRRLTPDLALDPTWDEAASLSLHPSAMVVLSDGKVLANPSGTRRSSLALFNEDGSLNQEFEKARPFYGYFSVWEQAPGNIVLPGGFLDYAFDRAPALIRYSLFAEPALSFARERFRVYRDEGFASARVQRKGPLDSSSKVRVRTENGSLRAGADFAEADLMLEFAPGEASKIARAALLGQPTPAGNLFFVLDPPEGAVLVKPARAEVQLLPVPAGEFVLDLGFNPRTGPEDKRDDVATTFAIQPGLGLLSSVFIPGFGAGDAVVRLDPNGEFDESYVPTSTHSTNGIHKISAQGDRIYLAGAFWRNLWRLMPNGTPDSDFSIDSAVFPYATAILELPSGKLLLGAGSMIARLYDSGLEDRTFPRTSIAQNSSDPISEMVLQPDGLVLVAGASLWRVRPEGGLDTSFVSLRPTGSSRTLPFSPTAKFWWPAASRTLPVLRPTALPG